MVIRRTLAAFVAVLVLSLSLSSAVCDASCAFNQPQAHNPAQTPMEAMDQAHCQHETTVGQIEQPNIQASSSCNHHHPCVDPAKLSIQKVRPMSPKFSAAVLTVVAHAPRRDAFVVTRRSRIDTFASTLLDTPSVSLRI